MRKARESMSCDEPEGFADSAANSEPFGGIIPFLADRVK